MPAPRILLVKLSSLGDVIHLFPAVSDLRARMPDAHVAWAVEEPYVGLVRLHPGVDRAIPVALRRLRREPFSARAWRDVGASRRALRAGRWDYVIDAQGLVKSACVARWARAPAFGLDAKSARERLAARFYDVKIRVPRDLHAVERNRRLVGGIFGYPVEGTAARYGLAAPETAPAWAPARRYAVLLHAASRPAKLWAEARWIELARLLARDGYTAVFPGGTPAERQVAQRLAAASGEGAIAAPPMELADAAALIAHASGVVGVDTGLSHLAVALGVPTVGIYCATSPRLTGLHGSDIAVNLGAPGAPPGVAEVAAAAGVGNDSA